MNIKHKAQIKVLDNNHCKFSPRTGHLMAGMIYWGAGGGIGNSIVTLTTDLITLIVIAGDDITVGFIGSLGCFIIQLVIVCDNCILRYCSRWRTPQPRTASIHEHHWDQGGFPASAYTGPWQQDASRTPASQHRGPPASP